MARSIWRRCAALMALGVACLTGVPAAAAVETYQLLIFSDAKPGQEEAYNSWYDSRHIKDVVALPGFVEARRYIINEQQFRGGSTPPGRYLAAYTVRTDNLPAVFAEMSRRIKAGETKMSDTLDVATLKAFTYRAIREPVIDKTERQVLPTHMQLVFTDATEGQEQEYNDWYDAQHAPDIVSVPGFLKGQRFVSSDVQMVAAGPSKYLVRFDIATQDFAKTAEVFGQMAPKMKMSKSFKGATGFTYRAIGPVVTHAKGVSAVGRR